MFQSKVVPKYLQVKYRNKKDFACLVCHPKTGTNWLSAILEAYFEKPVSNRVYFESNLSKIESEDFITSSSHDEGLAFKPNNVIYLYRDPVEVIFSFLNHKKIEQTATFIHSLSEIDQAQIHNLLDVYIAHLKKWLIDDNFTDKKTIVRYDCLKNNLRGELEKISLHVCGIKELDEARFINTERITSKESMSKILVFEKEFVNFENKFINMSVEYANVRKLFKEKYSSTIMEKITNSNLEKYFL